MNVGFLLNWLPTALLVGAVLGRLLERRVPGTVPRPLPGWVDAVLFALLAVAGCVYVNRLHNLGNPFWLPAGQDWLEFLGLALELKNPGLAAPVANRYPFYPWLGVRLAGLEGFPVYMGCMQVSILAAGLLPAFLFLLTRELAPRSIALVAAVSSIHGRILLTMLGPPTDYLLYAALQVAVLGTGTWALRRGGALRHLAFGTALALLMATAAKALVLLTVAAPFMLARLGWQVWRRPWRTLSEAGAFLLPLVIVWVGYSRIDRPLLPLERIVLTAQESVADERGYEVMFPTDLGWGSEDPSQHGYWRVGRIQALLHLPDTYRFLLRGAPGNAPRSERVASVLAGLRTDLPIPHPLFILLAVPGCLAAVWGWRRSGDPGLVDSLIAAAFLSAALVAEWLGVTGNLFVPRYALVLSILLPPLMLCGITSLFRWIPAGEWRHRGWIWWPAAAVAFIWVIAGDGPMGRLDAQRHLETLADQRASSREMALARLARLPQEAAVLDMSGTRVLPDLLPGKFVYPYSAPHEPARFLVAPTNLRRRFVIQPCQFTQTPPVPRWVTSSPDRLEPFSACIDEDTLPNEVLVLHREDPETG